MIFIFKSIAHIRDEDGSIQSVEEHLLGVKALSEKYGEKIGVKHIAGLAGMLHDLGKYTNEFSDYIYKAVHDPAHARPRGSVDHSTAGGKLMYELFHGVENSNYKKLLAEIVGNAIISHHSYLHDYLGPHHLESPYLTRVRDKKLNEYSQTKKMFFERVISKDEFYSYVDNAVIELETFVEKSNSSDFGFQMMFLTKYIFSCLIDADRTNTRQFVEKEDPLPSYATESSSQLFQEYLKKLMKQIEEFKDSKSKIDTLRSEMSEQCARFAGKPSDIYTLSIPTGGGKTLSSFRYALKHALKYNKKRIIYIVPYTTIIEQNAKDIRDLIEDDVHLLEHHSNVFHEHPSSEEEDIYESKESKILLLAKDNWDAPIIFTTMVQFLNVFYDGRNRNVRRLHNLSESVIIFDEVQKVPTHCISLFNRALNFLNEFAETSILLCTATQPALKYVEHQLNITNENSEIVTDLPNVVESFKRVDLVDLATSKKYSTASLTQFITNQIEQDNSILVLNYS